MPGWVREGMNPSPAIDPLNSISDYFRIKPKGGRMTTKKDRYHRLFFQTGNHDPGRTPPVFK